MTTRRPIRTPDIAELRAFCAAADLGTLGRAAIALGVSQPALSKRLRALEAAAGADLLTRSPTGVTLTAAGRRLYPEARRLLDQAEVVDELLGVSVPSPRPSASRSATRSPSSTCPTSSSPTRPTVSATPRSS